MQKKDFKEILVIKLLFVLLIIIQGCSIDTKTGLWNKTQETKKNNNEQVLFLSKNKEVSEFNPFVKIKLNEKFITKIFHNNISNNIGMQNYDGLFDDKSKFKFSKIKSFNQFNDSFITTDNNNIIIFDGEGTIIKLDQNLKKIWKKNFYNKKEKKLKPKLNFASNKEILIVTDSLSNYFAINILDGILIWKKSNNASFNAQIKIQENKFYTVDNDNIIRSYNVNNGSKNWEYKTENTFIKSTKKASIALDRNNLYFINPLGDVMSINLKEGFLNWQLPTQSSSVVANTFSEFYSDIVHDDNSLYFSNNKNEFYAVNSETGKILWLQNVNSILAPIILEKLIFTISSNNHLVILEKKSGNIIRSTKLLSKNKKDNLNINNFLLIKNKALISFGNGSILTVNILDGKIVSYRNLSNDKFSRPIILNKKLYFLEKNKVSKFK